MKRNFALTLCAGLLVCGASLTQSRPAAAKAPVADNDFLMQAAQGNLAEIQAGELAWERSSNVNVKRLARKIAEDHKMAQNAVTAMGTSSTISWPTTPDTMQQESYEDLERLRGDAFDHAFIKNQIMAHKKAIWTFREQLKDSSDPQVKTFAWSMLPTLERHLEELKYLKAQCNTWSAWN